MKKTVVTIIDHWSGNSDHDEKAVCIGWDPQKGYGEAMDALRHACCTDFTNPSSCKPGYSAYAMAVEAAILEPGEDADEAAEAMGFDWADEITLEGQKVLVDPSGNSAGDHYYEWSSDDIRAAGEWPARIEE